MKKIIFIFTFLLLCVLIQAQTFVCTDINFYGSTIHPQKIQKEKARYLGSKATLTFYDKSLKILANVDGKTESLVLDKINDNEYQAIEKKGNNVERLILKLNKWAAYIRSFTVETYKNYSLEVKATFKRD